MGFAEGTPTVTIELGGISYELGFTMGAMRRARDLGVLNLDAEDQTAFMLALPEYVWSCLPESGREALTVEAIGELMNPGNVVEIAEKVGDLFKASVPKEKPGKNAHPGAVKKPTPGRNKSSTSTSSGQQASTISA